MKTTLLFFLCGYAAFSQTPVPALYGQLAAGTVNGINHRVYVGATAATPVDESAAGANATWNFSGLTAAGTDTYDNAAPTFGESTTYPGTTMVTTQDISGNESKAYFNASGVTSFTGADTNGFQLNYSTDNATIGTFPLNYGYANTDAMAGTYVYQNYSGDFQGTIASSVDAYGTLNLADIGFGAQTYNVTRLKIVQNFTISYLIFSNAGSVTMTTYAYFTGQADDKFPVVTSTTTSIVVPLLSINSTTTAYEAAMPLTLAAPSFQASDVSVWPNPVQSVLHIDAAGVREVSVSDMNGREMLKRENANDIDLSPLSAGTYLVKIKTDSAVSTRKILKQ
jgi:hypothetical protein